MKKIILAFIFLVFAAQGLRAQASAIDGMVEYQKGHNKHSSVIELPYPPEIVENAIKEDMAKRGYKPEKVKGGVQMYRGVQLHNDSEVSDLHFKVERKSRQEKNVSKVHLIVGRASENVALRDQNDMHKSEHGKSFLNDLAPMVAAHHLDVSIKDQEDLIKKAEKKLKNLEDDQNDYEKKMNSLQNKLEENRKNQENQTAEINKQRSIRDAMHARKVQ